MEKINSNKYWDKRFEGDWSNMDGEYQTEMFAKMLLENLPFWLENELRIESKTVCDAGCALGQLLEQWHNKFPNSKCSGFDFSKTAVVEAAKKYKDFKFFQQDIKTLNKTYDTIICSNVLEHFKDSFEIAEGLVKNINEDLIIMVPFEQYDYSVEHENFFDLNSFPLVLGDAYLSYIKVIDARKIENTPWYGKQIVVIYSKKDAIMKRNLKALYLFNRFIPDSAYVEELVAKNNSETEKQNNLLSEKDLEIRYLKMIAGIDEDMQVSRIEKLTSENIELKNTINDLNSKLELHSQVNIDNIKNIVMNLESIKCSKSEKFAFFIRMVKYDFCHDFKEFLLIIPKLFLKLFGKKNVFIKYAKIDGFQKEIKKLEKMIN